MGEVSKQLNQGPSGLIRNCWKVTNACMYVACCLGIITLLIFTQSKQTDATNETDLEKFVAVLQAENIIVTEWSIYAREMFPGVTTKKELDELVAQLLKKFPEWNWLTTQTENHIQVTGYSQMNGYDESIEVTFNDKSNQGALLSYNMKGDHWGETSAHFVKNASKSRIRDIFTQIPTIFSCVKGVFNDTIEKDLSILATDILEAFNGEEIEKLAEDTFISVTAYSSHFKQAITHHENDINVQLGIRKNGLGLQSAIVIGTPIITIEY